MIEESVLETHLDNLIGDYHGEYPTICCHLWSDLQTADVSTFDQPPSAFEALRMINRSQPVVIKGVFVGGTALLIEGFSPVTAGTDTSWGSKSTYSEIMGRKAVSIAVTDDG